MGPSSRSQANFFKATLTPAIVATITTAAQAFTVTGVRLGQSVLVNPPSHVAGVSIASAFVNADDSVTIIFVNPTAAGVTPPAGVYRFTTWDE